MPFAKRAIEPVRLSRGTLGKEYKFDLDVISNNTLCGLLRQLSSLATKADSIFSEITEEFVAVVQKTERLRNRIGEVKEHVGRLNAKSVTVPVGDLTTFASESDHYQAEHGFDCYLFAPASRPKSVVDLYDSVTPSPISTIRRCNILRSDGKTGSKFFSPAPVMKDEKYEDPELEISSFRKPPMVKFRKPVQVLQIERETRELKSPRHHDRPYSMSALTELDINTNKSNITLPTPEQKLREISRSQPVTLVPIDVSGSSFNRMCDYRSSIRSINTQYEVMETGTTSRTARRKSRRRQTLSGMPGFVFDEISTDYFKVGSLRTRSASRERWERPRSMAFTETYTPSGKRGRSRERRRDRSGDREDSPVSKSCSLRRSFRSLFRGGRSRSQDLWAEGRPRSPGPPMIDINIPLRRSRSLPRSLKSVMRVTPSSKLGASRSASTEGRLDGWTDQELLEKDIPWVRGKPPTGTGRPANGPHIPRSRSQTVDRRRSAYVESDDSSIGLSRPHSLRMSLSQGHLRAPIPVSMPTTPGSAESLMSGATIDSQNRMNIPARGAAWGPFASVKLRHAKGNTPDDRQSSSGNWSASSSSARQSLESEYNRLVNSPEKRSQTSLDKDSALSLNIHSSSEDRCFSYYEGYYDMSDLYMYTTDNNGDLGEETSTITGDTSTLNGGDTTTEDTSTLNGDQDSVVNVRANFTKMKTDEWLKSLKKEKSSRRKSSRDSNGSGLTLQNLKAHDSAHKPFVRSLTRLPDEESSVYSVDQEGFYTSMHRDSGLKRSQSEMIEEETQFELESFMSSSNSTLACSKTTSKPSRAEKVRRRSTSFLSNLPGLKKIKGGGKKQKKTPPPPPRRVSTVLDKSNLTLDQADCGSPPTPSSELSKSADTSTETVINTSMQAPTSSSSKHNDSSCESDAEAIYARIKTKSSISAAAIPSLCSITPVGSDEEDADMLSFARTWRANSNSPSNDTSQWSGSLMSTKSAPGALLEGQVLTSTPLHTGIGISRLNSTGNRSNDDLSISDTMTRLALNDSSKGESSMDCSGFSTWPRSPASKGERMDEQKPPCPPRTLNFASSGFNPRDACNVIPEGKTPEESNAGSFKGSNDGSFGGSDRDGTSSKGTSSVKSPSTSSIPSSFSDDMPIMPPKLVMRPHITGGKNPYLPHMADGASLSGGSGGSACTSPVNKSSSHVFANVVVKSNGPLSASSSGSSLSYGFSNSTLPTKSHANSTKDFASVTSTWPRQVKSKSDNQKSKESGSLKKKDKKILSTFAPLEKEEDKEEEDEEDEDEESLALSVSSYSGPVPAPAKLIISAPVATKVSFKENPYKRSVCSPVTTQELMSFWSMDVKNKPYNSPTSSAFDGSDMSSREPSPSAFTPVIPSNPNALGPLKASTPQAVSKPLYPTLTSMKHSITFPVTTKEEAKPEEKETKDPTPSYGRSWYDGIKTKSEVVPITTSLASTSGKPSLASRMSLTSFSSDSPTPSLLDQRRDSISSNISNDSGSKKHVTFATVNKASPASSQYSLKMDDGTASLTGSVTGSIGSNDSGEKKTPFSSFVKLGSTPTSSLRRNSSGSSSSSLKSILSSTSLPVQMPIPPNTIQATPMSSSPSPVYHRPTSLALSKVVDTPSKRLQSIGEGPSSDEVSATASSSIGATKSGPLLNTTPRKPVFDPRTKVIMSNQKTPSHPSPLLENNSASTTSSLNRSPRHSPSKDRVKGESMRQGTGLGLNRKQPVTAKVSPIMQTDRAKGTTGERHSKAAVASSPVGSPKMHGLAKAEPVKFRMSSLGRKSSNDKEGSPRKEIIGRVTPTQKVIAKQPVVSKANDESKVKQLPSSPTKGAEVKQNEKKDLEKTTTETPKSEAVRETVSKSGIKVDNSKSVPSKNASTTASSLGKPDVLSTKSPPTVLNASGTLSSGNTSKGVQPVLKDSDSEKKDSKKDISSQPAGVLVNKPPPSPATSSSSTLVGSTLNKSTCSTGASSPPTPKMSTVLTTSTSSLSPSVGNDSVSSLNKSTSSLDISSCSLKGSRLSLNKSTDSLASNSSASSVIERTRAARLAFLNQSAGSPTNSVPEVPPADPFARFKSPNTGTGPAVTNSVDDRFAKYKIGQRKGSTGSTNSSGSIAGSPPADSPTQTGPSQGRFVNSVINTLATKSGGDSPTSPTTPSSGLGSSIASPLSPVKQLPATDSITKAEKKDIQSTLASGAKSNNVNSNNNNNDSRPSTSPTSSKKETCC